MQAVQEQSEDRRAATFGQAKHACWIGTMDMYGHCASPPLPRPPAARFRFVILTSLRVIMIARPLAQRRRSETPSTEHRLRSNTPGLPLARATVYWTELTWSSEIASRLKEGPSSSSSSSSPSPPRIPPFTAGLRPAEPNMPPPGPVFNNGAPNTLKG